MLLLPPALLLLALALLAPGADGYGGFRPGRRRPGAFWRVNAMRAEEEEGKESEGAADKKDDSEEKGKNKKEDKSKEEKDKEVLNTSLTLYFY